MITKRCFVAIFLGWIIIGKAEATEGDPLTATVNVSNGYDSNLLRLPSNISPTLFVPGGTRGDDYTSYTGNLALNVPYKLQRFDANVNWNRIDFDHYNNFLSHTNSSLNGDWWWQIGNLWSGQAGYSHSRLLMPLESFAAPIKDIYTTANSILSADYQIVPDWTVGAAFNDTVVRRGLPEFEIYNSEGKRADLNLRYVGSPGNSVGLQVSANNVDYPNPWQIAGLNVNASYRETLIRATLDWSPTGTSHLSGSAGYDQINHQQLNDRNFSGITGRLVHTWDITGKTRLETTLWREISPISSLSNYVLTEGVSVAPTWNYSSVLSFQLKVIDESSNYGGGTASTSSALKENYNQTTLTLNYQPLQAAVFSFDYNFGARNANAPNYDFRYSAWTATAQFSF